MQLTSVDIFRRPAPGQAPSHSSLHFMLLLLCDIGIIILTQPFSRSKYTLWPLGVILQESKGAGI